MEWRTRRPDGGHPVLGLRVRGTAGPRTTGGTANLLRPHTLGNIAAGNSWWPQCCAQIHQQLCRPFTNNNDVHASRGPVKMSLSWSRTCGKMAYQYTCSSKRKRVAAASAVIIAIVLYMKAARRRCNRRVCQTVHGSLTARGKEHLITSCRRYAFAIYTSTGILLE